ncbi:putative membrane protein [Halalkaliarchaeum sp. AArc-CO]|uniref:hypothetical protein n=1 Tax=Halalkaliarchaeum sp. AArc-CO TaxID=2866381 RepID=UPI00217EB561|nr:hypothetical protein [Halalkaliarchaeum sp. AArc-CO]UWG49652.1 putative membrane protein [Halalkaliarchaeum sp. AArc-CO]
MARSRRPRRRTVAIAIVLAIAVVFGVGALLEPTTHDPPEVEQVTEEDLVQPVEDGSYLWPYTSRGETTSERTLAINLLVHGPDDAVRRSLTDRTSFEFEEEEEPAGDEPDEHGVVVDDEGLEWADAHGAVRYSYVDASPRGGDAVWLTEAYQLHSGTYLGERYHVRAYTHPEEDWTAIQAHTDYWDWFRLRHTVPDIHEAGLEIESDYLEAPFVEEVRREYHGIEGGYSDGWISVIELESEIEEPDDLDAVDDPETGLTDKATTDEATADEASDNEATADDDPHSAAIEPLGGGGVAWILGLLGIVGIAGILAAETRRDLARAGRAVVGEISRRRRAIALATALAGIVLGVRVIGIGVETAVPALHPKAIAAVLYPILALGMPAAALLLARGTEPWAAASFALLGAGGAFAVDFGMVSVSFLPIRLVLHRIGLLLALTLIAAGSAMGDERGKQFLAAGLAAWFLGLGLPLADVI